MPKNANRPQMYFRALTDAALAKNNPVWMKKLATMHETEARTLRLVCGPSGTKNRVPLGVLYTEPTNALVLKQAFDLAGAEPTIEAVDLAERGKVRLHEARQAIRWANAVRGEFHAGPANTECVGLYAIGAGKNRKLLKIKVLL
jgi:hypothetical protein